jgi:hypothetical protein
VISVSAQGGKTSSTTLKKPCHHYGALPQNRCFAAFSGENTSIMKEISKFDGFVHILLTDVSLWCLNGTVLLNRKNETAIYKF